MIDTLRTLRAKFIVQYLNRPHPRVIRAWFWLAEQTDDIEEKRRCFREVLELDPENKTATLALLLFD